ncbi:MAG TPA: FHA domain-containing protein [Isosphaeraceae bacterium]|nr:FHA domain-containing protein [Isosphaeraceae bacterium]
MADSPTQDAQPAAWSLAVVRGREVGRVYALAAGETILGNALNGAPGLDLSDQEGGLPRRMAARHAAVTLTGQEAAIRDLDSPGGTFVNRQRLLAGQSRRLQPGDVIQLGGVQLRLERRTAAPPGAAAPGPQAGGAAAMAVATTAVGRLPVPFAMAAGPSCRTWDDFLALAAQRWIDLRDELSSGRLAEYLRKIQRIDLVPRLEPSQSPDEQLDQWLARLPASRSSAPELDVHPEVVTVRAVTGGGITRQALRVSNTGYRLLRCIARVEPAGTRWLRLRPEHDGRPFFTIEETDLSIELEIPEVLDCPLTAAIVLESNGGTRRVGVRIERPVPAVEPLEPATDPGAGPVSDWVRPLGAHLARWKPGVRIAAGVLGATLFRSLVVLIGMAPVGGSTGSMAEPRLAALALALAVVGVVGGGILGSRQGDRRDLVSAGFAGGLLGLLAAAVLHAVVRSVERLLGSWSSSLGAVGLLWAAIGAVLAGLATWLVPYRPDNDHAEATP